jgi:hypothetical protein
VLHLAVTVVPLHSLLAGPGSHTYIKTSDKIYGLM